MTIHIWNLYFIRTHTMYTFCTKTYRWKGASTCQRLLSTRNQPCLHFYSVHSPPTSRQKHLAAACTAAWPATRCKGLQSTYKSVHSVPQKHSPPTSRRKHVMVARTAGHGPPPGVKGYRVHRKVYKKCVQKWGRRRRRTCCCLHRVSALIGHFHTKAMPSQMRNDKLFMWIGQSSMAIPSLQ